MSTLESSLSTPNAGNGRSAPRVDAERLIQQQLSERRVQLQKELGLEAEAPRQFAKPEERPFTGDERSCTTVLFGGLTWKHEHLIHGALEGLGYKCEYLPTPDVQAFQLGKEFGNNGQCNPTYFTVGNLVKFLQGLEQDGLSREEIINNHVFLTAGACGPCRFGMYEAEYRLALRNSGFDGFRILLFQQSGGLNQSEVESGLELNTQFFLAILNAMNMGDLLNDVAYQIRPFEVQEGETDQVLRECLDELHDVMKNRVSFRFGGRLGDLLRIAPRIRDAAEMVGKIVQQFCGARYTDKLREIADRLNNIEVDRTRLKPTVKITGEFWAQTTEGDGNYNLFRFLEREGAQVLVEPVGTWVMYMVHQAKLKKRDRLGIEDQEQPIGLRRLGRQLLRRMRQHRSLATLTLAESIFKREWNRMRRALSYMPHALTDQYHLQRLGHPFYNSRSGGGEGHLEIAKNIYYHSKALCHMVLSLKPFGCMPSTQSDGAQSAVMNRYKDMIYLPIETSGEGEINAHSRVQMALGEAKAKCRNEFDRVLAGTGSTLDEIREYAKDHPQLNKALYVVPHAPGIVGTASVFVHHVARLMGSSPNADHRRASNTRELDAKMAGAASLRDVNKELVVIDQH